MLTTQNAKQLSGEWQRQRARALQDSSGFPATGERFALDDLSVTIEGLGINDPLTYQIDSSPVDNGIKSNPKGRAVDIRKLPGHD